ncbi:MAG TPA: amidohydrolase family protein [Terriglobales bacterium]
MIGYLRRLLIFGLTFAPWLNAQQQPVAFVDVTVVPMDKEQILVHQTVVVEGNRITQVGSSVSTKVPPRALKIAGRGKYLMPGLADMHVHLIRSLPEPKAPPPVSGSSSHPAIIPTSASSDHEHENQALGVLFIANGVTTVRNMWGDSAIDAFAKQVESGKVVGPVVYSTGPLTDGSPLTWEGSRLVETQAQAEAAVKQDKAAGYIAIKVYNGLSTDAYGWIISAARAQDLPVVGHVPDAVGLRGVITARQDSIEHLDGFWEALQPDQDTARNASGRQLLDRADLAKLPALVESIRAAAIWNCPTLDLDRILPNDLEWRGRVALVPPALVERYRRAFSHWQADPELTRRAFQLQTAITRGLHQGHARLLLGTDTPKPTVLPGFSLLEELQNFVEAGLTPYEAIRAGTSDAAIFLHQDGEFGVVATGRRADLLLLEKNPLEDVNNVSKRVGVMANGRWFTEQELQQRLMALRNGSQH